MVVFNTRLDFGPSVKMTAGRTESCQDKDLADNTYRLKRTERSVYVFFRWKGTKCHRGGEEGSTQSKPPRSQNNDHVSSPADQRRDPVVRTTNRLYLQQPHSLHYLPT
ncbi:hypothetical protein CHARACLAT_016274 [Characodon lateralis]|uniref:Uncharacterized protein n=1 Tax=Characodon lateralis TaxID=208331 RepID=A0ABU7E1P3_9TELE|nr:hypothetical protein [Characodon lateralis]